MKEPTGGVWSAAGRGLRKAQGSLSSFGWEVWAWRGVALGVGGAWVRLGGAAAQGCASAQPLLRAETAVTGCGRGAGWGAREEGVF